MDATLLIDKTCLNHRQDINILTAIPRRDFVARCYAIASVYLKYNRYHM